MVDEERPDTRTDEQAARAESADEPDGASAEEPLNGCEAPPTSSTLEAAIEQPPDASDAAVQDQRVRLAEDRLAQVLGAFRQLKVDNEGFKDRTRRNIERRFDQRSEKLLLKFIDVLDNFDRALESAEGVTTNTPLFEGLILVRTQLLQILQQEGLERIPVLGMPFDPYVAEAVGMEPVEDPSYHHIVVREILRGYRYHDRLVRPVRVILGECAESEQEAPAAPAETEQPAPSTTAASAPESSPTPAFDALDDAATQAEILAAGSEEKESAGGEEPAPAPAQDEKGEASVSDWVAAASPPENREGAEAASSASGAPAPTHDQSEGGEDHVSGWMPVAPTSNQQNGGADYPDDRESPAPAQSEEDDEHVGGWVAVAPSKNQDGKQNRSES